MDVATAQALSRIDERLNELARQEQSRFARPLFVQTSDKTVVNTTASTSLIGSGEGSVTIPARYLQPGRVIRITASGWLSDTGNPSLEIRTRLSGTTVCSTGANALNTSVTAVDWRLEVTITCRQAGSSGQVQGGGYFSHDDGADFGMVELVDTPINTTVDLVVQLQAQWGTASASNKIVCQQCVIEVLA